MAFTAWAASTTGGASTTWSPVVSQERVWYTGTKLHLSQERGGVRCWRTGLNIFRYHWFYLNWGNGLFVRWQWVLGVLELLVCWYHRERIHPTGQKLHFVTTHWFKTLQHPLHISVFWLSNVNYLRKQAKFNSLYKLMPTKGKLFDQKKNMYVMYIYIHKYNHEPCRCTFLLRQKPQKNRWGASPGIGLLVVWSNREKEDFRFISSVVQTSEDFTGISRHCFFERVGWLVGWLILWNFGQIASKKNTTSGVKHLKQFDKKI